MNNDDVLVSVVVPVYNVQKYLMRCYESIASQTYDNWEAILVDDGSTDDSGKICDQIAEKDERITVVHKKNEGLGLARNHGVSLCNGEYVLFLDSDDYIENDTIEFLLNLAVEYRCDLVIGNKYYQGKAIDLPLNEGAYRNNEITTEIIPRIIGCNPGNADQLTPSSCGNLYKRRLFLVNDLWFPSERQIIWEDLAFNFEYLQVCSSVYLTEKPVYNYCYNGESLTHKYDSEKLQKVMKMYRYMKKRIDDTNMTNLIGDRLENNFIGHIRTCLKLETYYSKENGVRTATKNIKRMCEHEDVRAIISKFDSRYYSSAQRLLAFGIKHKLSWLVYMLCVLQNGRKEIA